MAEDPVRARLTDLRNGLLKLHKALLDSERANYERDVARITTTGQYLNLVLNDPWFGWLRDLSQFIVLIDETLDFEDPATSADADRLIGRARDLIAPSENGQVFARSYYEAMQRDPAAVLAHRDMMRVFAGLNRPE
ncbi:MAG: hypothetical protein JO323_26895 [Acidobacteriia bacterium]|nr:hypothetical protein [Terriglobia bacterium]